MRIPGTTFSDSNIKEINYENLMEWSRKAINILMKSPNEDGSEFKIIVTLHPNDLDHDGLDQTKIDIFRTHRNGEVANYLWKSSWNCTSLTECIKRLNVDLAKVEYQNNNPEIIKINGKKYKLTEIE